MIRRSDPKPQHGMPIAGGRAATLHVAAALGALVLASLACARADLALAGLGIEAPNPLPGAAWSTVSIAKPTKTQFAPEPTSIQAPESVAPEPVATAEDREDPVITMVIVDEDVSSGDKVDSVPAANPDGKYVLVSISQQHLYAYEGGELVYSFVASTGMGNSTRAGTFHVLDKIPNAYGANWNIWMPNWMGIFWSGPLENGIHALPILPGGARLWAGYLGTPISYGCVVLGIDEATQLYDWAEVGTPVEIRW